LRSVSGSDVIMQKNSGPEDASPALRRSAFAGMPVLGMPDFTSTVIALLDIRPGNFLVPVIRPIQVKYMGAAGDADTYQISSGCAFVVKNPVKHGKLTGVTA